MPSVMEHEVVETSAPPTPGASDSLAPWEPALESLVAPAVPLGPLRPRGQTRRWVVHLIKGLLVAIEIPIILVLAMSAGLLQVLPPKPPTLDVSANGHTAHATPVAYCWFTPGHGACAAAPAAPPPVVAATRDMSISMRLGYPPPTTCAVTANATPTSSPLHLRSRPEARGAYTIAAPHAPGIYIIDVSCHWMSNPALRWLQGLGDAEYSVALRVDG